MSYITNNNQIARNTLFLYMRMFFTMAVSLYTVRVVLQTLSVADYGLYGAVGGVILTFNFITGVLTSASQRFFSVELGKNSGGQVREVFSTLFLIYIGVAFVVFLLAETIGLWFLINKMTIPEGRENAALWVYQFALLSFIVTLLTNPFQALIIAHERMNLYAYLSILDVTLKLVIVYLLIFTNYDKLKVYSALIFCSYLIINLIYILYCKIIYLKAGLIWKVDKSIFINIFSYSTWTLLGTLAGIFNTQGMNLLLNLFFGTFANAAYSIASQVYNTVGLFATNFYTAVKPPLIKSYSCGNYIYVNKLFLLSSKTIFILLFVVILPLMVCTEAILNIWLGQIGEYMIAFVKLSLLYTTILTISYPITAVVQAGGFVKMYHTLVDGFSLLALPIVYVLFKLGFDAIWSYIVTIIIISIAHVLRLYVLKKVFSLFDIRSYLIKFLVPSVLLFGLLYILLIHLNIYTDDHPLNIFFICGICSISALICSLFVVLSASEREMIINIFKKNSNNVYVNI